MPRTLAKKVVLPALFLLHACADTPSMPELRHAISSVTFFQYGAEPLNYAFGVVDTGSFWADNGSGVSANLGGSVLAEGAAAAGRSQVAKKTAAAAEIMRGLYNNHPLVNEVSKGILPKLAQLWHVSYNPGAVHMIAKGVPLQDTQGNLTAVRPTTDLALVFTVNNLALTEKRTFGRALTAGLTLGTNTKMVSAETTVTLLAYKRDLVTGQYKNIWMTVCQGPAQASRIDYPFPEVIKSKEKAKELWDAAIPVTIEACSNALAAIAKRE